MAELAEDSGARPGEKNTANGAVQSASPPMTLLGRPAVVLTLSTGDGASCGERNHKRSRPNDAGDAGGDEGGPGGIRQVVRSMLRAQKLGVLVPLVYHADVFTGEAVVEAVPGRRLRELVAAAAAAPAEPTTRPAAEAEASAAAAADLKTLPEDLNRAAALLGRALALLHDGGQVHNNLSGDTVVLRESDGAVVLTDFSRSYNTIVALDKAQDLASLETALLKAAEAVEGAEAGTVEQRREARVAAQLFEKVLASYRAASRLWSATHNKLAEVRGRATQPQNKRPKTATADAAAS
ncbi:hypothetical protein PLESTB_000075400 [Pleodorina starrii]|uniref:non-specific serine/threonine protein kinase n=1 Tax=Pleodorina starrii TaxID=330485 RepID=A0A9W6BAJ8_9CHLO|nr:hypothetical protein PLESTB_000075400 [Pleodorina starrii]GLC66539.1 hypothetical protein PLESTF_000441600 [Pleodorina starrii]